ncbi:hypothetical protein ACWEGE_01720 [Amycolatopsis sp. NPDC004747]
MYRFPTLPTLAIAALLSAGACLTTAGTAQASAVAEPEVHVAAAVPAQGLPVDWVARGSGQFGTADALDLLEYTVELNAVPQEVVEFRLTSSNRCHWGKTLVMPDGLGSSWDIHIDPSQGIYSDSNGLWAQQVHNHQHLTLLKAGFLGVYYQVLVVGDLDAILPGSRVTFRWLTDSRIC